MPRPSVSTIVPFRGTVGEFADVVGRLATVQRRDGDEVILVWNSAEPLPRLHSRPEWLQTCVAAAEASSYYARNVGARSSRNEWLLFIDADCSPNPGLLDLYFAAGEHASDVGIVAGGIVGITGDTLVERYANARDHLDQRHTLRAKPLGYGQTANLLVRARVWKAIGGYTEGIISGGDADLCWRAQLAGVKLTYEPAAAVGHHHRQSIAELWRQYQKYGRGQRWLHTRFGDRWPDGYADASFSHNMHDVLEAVASRSSEPIRFLLLDALTWAAFRDGWLRSNTAPLLTPPEGHAGSRTSP